MIRCTTFLPFNPISLQLGREKQQAIRKDARVFFSIAVACDANKFWSTALIESPLTKQSRLCFISSGLCFVSVVFCSTGQRSATRCCFSLSIWVSECAYRKAGRENIAGLWWGWAKPIKVPPSTHFQLISKANYAINKSFPGLPAHNSIKRSARWRSAFWWEEMDAGRLSSSSHQMRQESSRWNLYARLLY